VYDGIASTSIGSLYDGISGICPPYFSRNKGSDLSFSFVSTNSFFHIPVKRNQNSKNYKMLLCFLFVWLTPPFFFSFQDPKDEEKIKKKPGPKPQSSDPSAANHEGGSSSSTTSTAASSSATSSQTSDPVKDKKAAGAKRGRKPNVVPRSGSPQEASSDGEESSSEEFEFPPSTAIRNRK
jgi:hypothetical protein